MRAPRNHRGTTAELFGSGLEFRTDAVRSAEAGLT
jgi:hypothetical protein